jgi:hypothetical protein
MASFNNRNNINNNNDDDDDTFYLEDHFVDDTFTDEIDLDDDHHHNDNDDEIQQRNDYKDILMETKQQQEASTMNEDVDAIYSRWSVGVLGLCLVVLFAVLLGVLLPSERNNNDEFSFQSTQAPTIGSDATTSPTDATPTDGSDASSSRMEYFRNLAVEWSGESALQDPASPASMALDWLVNEDPFQLTQDHFPLDVQQRYIPAVLYFATGGAQWTYDKIREPRQKERHRLLQQPQHANKEYNLHHHLQEGSNDTSAPSTVTEDSTDSVNFLTGEDVCFWKTSDGKRGVMCDHRGLIIELKFGM